jgi:hypothetical protein
MCLPIPFSSFRSPKTLPYGFPVGDEMLLIIRESSRDIRSVLPAATVPDTWTP